MNIREKHGPSPRYANPGPRVSGRFFGAKPVVFDPISKGPEQFAGIAGRGSRSSYAGFDVGPVSI